MDDETLDTLAWTMLGEAADQGYTGMAAIGSVALNRLNEGYAGSLKDVLLQDKQFSTWNKGEGGNSPKSRYPKSSPAFQNARTIAERVVSGLIPDVTGGATNYWSPKGMKAMGYAETPYWANDEQTAYGQLPIGDHVFLPKREAALLPPGSLPEVGTELSTSIPRTFRYADQDSGNLIGREPTPTPAMRAGLVSYLNRPDDFVPARLPDLPPSTLDRRAIPQSIIERAPVAQPAPRGLLQALGSGSASARLAQGEMPAARGLLAGLAGNAGDSLARAPVMGDGASPMFNGAYSPSMDAITQIAPMASYGMNMVTPQRVVPQSTIERTPVQQAFVASNSETKRLASAPKSSVDPVGAGADWRNLQNTMQTPIPMGNVMTSQAPRVDTAGSGASWEQFTGAMAPKTQVAQPKAAPKAHDRLETPRLAALSFSPQAQAQAQLPNKTQLEAATGFRTVNKPTQIENPAYTKWKADNLSMARKPVPLGDVLHTGSRDSVAQAAAGANFVATAMPDRWLTVNRQVRVPNKPASIPVRSPTNPVAAPQVAAAKPNLLQSAGNYLMANTAPGQAIGGIGWGVGNLAAGRPLFGTTAQQPGALQTFGTNVLNSTALGGLLGMLFGQKQNTSQQAAPSVPVGTVLGTAANGGQMIQGFNGVQNSITQESDAWKKATGQSSYGSGQSNDTRYESYF